LATFDSVGAAAWAAVWATVCTVPPTRLPAPPSAPETVLSVPPTRPLAAEVSRYSTTKVVTAHDTSPCRPAAPGSGLPDSRPAIRPPASAAIRPEATNHRPAPSEAVAASGAVPAVPPAAARPTPTPTRLTITWVTSAVTTPAKMAPHDTSLSRTARVSA
jgi:hypothetical protein